MPIGHAALMRDVNGRVYEVLIEVGSEDGDFVCECDDEACTETVQLTLREFAALETTETRRPIISSAHAKQPA